MVQNGTFFAIVVFVACFYAALAVGFLINAYRSKRARRVAIARLDWRGMSQTEFLKNYDADHQHRLRSDDPEFWLNKEVKK